MNWDLPWYSAKPSLDALLVGRRIGSMHVVCYARDGDRGFETYWTTGRGVEAVDLSYRLMDLTVWGRQEPWENSPGGWPQKCTSTRTETGPPAWIPVPAWPSGRPIAEIADGVRPGGQAVDIRGAGRMVLSRMGLLDRARAMGLQQQGIADVDRRGRRRTEMTVGDFGGEGMISEIEILRGDLAQLLVDASVEAGASYVFATKISSLDNGLGEVK